VTRIRAVRAQLHSLARERAPLAPICSLGFRAGTIPSTDVFSKDSTAANFRSTCGSDRGPPECSTHVCPTETPHVGQGTDNSCSGVSSFFFIRTECKITTGKTVQFGTLSGLAAARKGAIISFREESSLVVKDDVQEGIIDLDLATVGVSDEAQFSEFVHEKIDPGPRCANHLRQHLLGYFGKRLVKITWRSIPREQEQSPRQSFLAGIEELVYEVFFDSNVSSQHVSDEAVGKIVFLVKHPNHLFLFNRQHGRDRDRGRSRYANGLARQAAFPEEISGSQDRHNGFSAGFIDHGKLHTAFPNVHYILRGIALRENGVISSELTDFSPQAGRV
jgi:hypothetical protein